MLGAGSGGAVNAVGSMDTLEGWHPIHWRDGDVRRRGARRSAETHLDRLLTSGGLRADEARVTMGPAFPEILAAARVGAEWAWERLYESIAGGVRGYLAAQGATDPDDLTGEVLLQLVRGLPRFEGDEAGFRSWVFLVAHHRLIDERRRRQRDAKLATKQLPTRPAPGADTAVLDIEVNAEWQQRLAELTDDQRHVILLRVVADLPADQVAHILGKRVGTVRVLQHRALARLRSDLTAGVTQ